MALLLCQHEPFLMTLQLLLVCIFSADGFEGQLRSDARGCVPACTT